MKKTISWMILLLVLATEAALVLMPRGGSSPVGPRVRLALETHKDGPKAELDKAVAKAMAEDYTESSKGGLLHLTLAAAFNVAFILAFANYGRKKRPLTETTRASVSRRGRA